MAELITTGVVAGERYEQGQTVCVVGRGTAAVIHRHGQVERFTKTMMIVKTTTRGVGHYRYRLGSPSALEVGCANGYGGTYVSTTCQRPRKG